MALDYPERVENVILIATSNRVKDNPVVRDYVLKEPVLGAWKRGLTQRGITTPEAVWKATPKDADPNAEDWILKDWDVDPVADQEFVKAIVPETAKVEMGTWIGATEALLELDNTDRLRELNVPTLVLWGTQDAIFYNDPDQTGIQAALKSAPGVGKVPIIWKQYGKVPLPKSGAQEGEIGHNVQWDAPKQVAADILAFLRSGIPSRDLPYAEASAGTYVIRTDPVAKLVEIR